MEINSIARSYLPAQLHEGVEWVIKYYCTDPGTGKRLRYREKCNHIKSIPDRRKHARRRVNEINALLAMGWNPAVSGSAIGTVKTLGDACNEFLAAKRREKRRDDTLRTYTNNVAHLVRWVARSPLPALSVSAFSEDFARQYMNESYIQRELSPKTFNNIHTFYITLFNWFIEMTYVKKNPFTVVKKKEVDPEGSSRRPPTSDERTLIREDLTKSNPRYFTFCMLCFHMAIRPKEAFMLVPQDIDLANQVIVVQRTVAKNKRTMGVAIPNVLLPLLQALNLASQDPSHYVFSLGCRPGPRLKNSRYSGKLWEAMRKRTGLSQDVTMYQLKHAGGEQLNRDGIGAVDLMNHFRHHDLEETSIYTRRATLEGVRGVVDKATAF